MHACSDFLNAKSSDNVRILRNAKYRAVSYNLIVTWYLKEWLAATGTSQADLVRLTDYPKAKVSDLVRGKQRYNEDIAKALNLYSYELLMAPEDAMRQRQMLLAVEQFARIPLGGTAGDLPGEKEAGRKAS
jgi:hypothetical protein